MMAASSSYAQLTIAGLYFATAVATWVCVRAQGLEMTLPIIPIL